MKSCLLWIPLGVTYGVLISLTMYYVVARCMDQRGPKKRAKCGHSYMVGLAKSPPLPLYKRHICRYLT